MTKSSNSSVEANIPNLSTTNVDLRRFSQYLRIANVITHLLLPDELTIDSPKKYFFSFVIGGYNPRAAIRHLVWHMACSLYTRALMDKSFFLADHKHLNVSSDTKKMLEMLCNVENLYLNYFRCQTIECRENRKFRQVAYKTRFSYFEQDLSSSFLKETIVITEFFWGFPLPQNLRGSINERGINKNKRLKQFIDLIELLYARKPLQPEKHDPCTHVAIDDINLSPSLLNTEKQKFESTIYPNLIFPAMIDKIEIKSDKNFTNDIRQAKATMAENLLKKHEETFKSILDGFKINADEFIEFLNSPSILAVATVASVSGLFLAILSFLGIDAERLFSIAKRIKDKKREDILHVKISPDGKRIYLMLDDEVLLELHESRELIFILALFLRNSCGE